MNRFIIIALITFSSFYVSGCWDSRDIDTMSFPIVAAYDLHPGTLAGSDIPYAMKDQHFVDVTVLSPNLTPQTKNTARVEKVASPTSAFARNNRRLESGRIYQSAAIQALVLGKDLAKIGLAPYLDSLYRSPIIPTFVHITVTPGRGEDILLTPVKNFTDAGTLTRFLLKDISADAFVPETTLHDWAICQSPGKNCVVPVIDKTGESGLHITGSAVFNKDRLVSILNLQDTRSLVLLRGIRSRGFIPFFIKNNGVVTETGTILVSNKRSVEVTRSGDHYEFLIKISLLGILEEFNGTKEIDESKIAAIEQQVAAKIRSECRSLVQRMQEEYKIDCVDISKYALAKWRRELTPVIDDGFIEHADIQVEVEVKLRNAGEAS